MSTPSADEPQQEDPDPTRQQLHDRLSDLEGRLDRFEATIRNLLTVNVDHDTDADLPYLAARHTPAQRSDLDEIETDLRTTTDQLHRERAKLARRVAALEEELGIAATDALAIAEGGQDGPHLSKLGRLLRYGPEAVNEHPTPTMFRARELVLNWTRWGTVRDDALGTERRLASKQHDLKTRLEDVRDETLAWRQVYRAMELIADWSDDAVTLEDGSDTEGRYVLVHHLDEPEEVAG